jgi:hypothetical protein
MFSEIDGRKLLEGTQCQRNKFLTWVENGVYSIYPLYEILVSYLKRQR